MGDGWDHEPLPSIQHPDWTTGMLHDRPMVHFEWWAADCISDVQYCETRLALSNIHGKFRCSKESNARVYNVNDILSAQITSKTYDFSLPENSPAFYLQLSAIRPRPRLCTSSTFIIIHLGLLSLKHIFNCFLSAGVQLSAITNL